MGGRTWGALLALALVGACSGGDGDAAAPVEPDPPPATAAVGAWSAGDGLVLRGRIVTMDADRTVVDDGRVLVRGERIEAVWSGDEPPAGVEVGDAQVIDLGPGALVYPGLVNLHDHPYHSVVPLWEPTQPTYDNRYEWNVMDERFLREVSNPSRVLAEPLALDLADEVVKWAEVRAILGGTTSTQGAEESPATDDLLVRNVDNEVFGDDTVEDRVRDITKAQPASVTEVAGRIASGETTTFLVHIAEGVRDGERRNGTALSSRAELDVLRDLGLLGEATAVIHGNALERADFAAMAAAGADLVWSPLSNLLFYGSTTHIEEALEEGVRVSLGTDWSPSGSRNLLGELKVADAVLGDPGAAQLLVEMVTVNPVATLGWEEHVGSVEEGKFADLLVVRAAEDADPYRALVDAVEDDVALVLVGGEPLAGHADLLEALKPGDVERVGGQAVDVTKDGVEDGDQTLAELEAVLSGALADLGDVTALRERSPEGAMLTDEQFTAVLRTAVGAAPDDPLWLEARPLAPLLPDDAFFDLVAGRVPVLADLREHWQP